MNLSILAQIFQKNDGKLYIGDVCTEFDVSEVKIKEEEVKIEILRPFHVPLLSTFCSYEQELVDFLVEDALENQNQRLSLTFLWIYEGSAMCKEVMWAV